MPWPEAVDIESIRPLKPLDLLVSVWTAVWVAYGVFDPSTAVTINFIAAGVLAWVLSWLSAVKPPSVETIAFAIFVGFTYLSIRWSVDPVTSRSTLRQTIAIFVLFILVRRVASSGRGYRLVCVGFAVGCLVAVWQIYLHLGSLRLSSGYGAFDREDLSGLNPNYLAYALVTGCVAIYFLALKIRRLTIGRAVFLTAMTFVLLVGVNQTGTRGALLGVVIAVVAWFGARAQARTTFVALVLLASAAAVTIATGGARPIAHALITPTSRDDGTLSGRIPTWDNARATFEAHPMQGVGAGAFRTINPVGIVAHNGILEVAADLGIIGLALIVVVFARCVVWNTRSLAPRLRVQTAGTFLAVTAPCLLSGHWIFAPPMWAMLAVTSQLRAGLVNVNGEVPDHHAR